MNTKFQIILVTAGILLLTATLHSQETDPSAQFEQANADAINSIHAYWQHYGDYPDNGLIAIPEGDWIPDFDDPDLNGLDLTRFQAWAQDNDAENADDTFETISFWMDEAAARANTHIKPGDGGDKGKNEKPDIANNPKNPVVLQEKYSRPGDAAAEDGSPIEVYETARISGKVTVDFSNCAKNQGKINIGFELSSVLSSDDPRIRSDVTIYNIFVYKNLLIVAPRGGQIKFDGQPVNFQHRVFRGVNKIAFSPGKGTKLKGDIEFLRDCNSNLSETFWIISNPRRGGPPHNLPDGHREIDHVWNLKMVHENGVVLNKSLSAIAKTTKDWDLAEMPKGRKYHLLHREGLVYDKLLVRRLRDLNVETPYVAPKKGLDAAGYNTVLHGGRPDNWRRPKNDPIQDVQIEKPKE